MDQLPKTTAGLLKYYAEHSTLGQGFAVDALTQKAVKVLASKDEVRKQLKDSFINPEAWIQAAEDWMNLWNKFSDEAR